MSSGVAPFKKSGAGPGGAAPAESPPLVPLVWAGDSDSIGCGSPGVSGDSFKASSLPVPARLPEDACSDNRPWLLAARLKGPMFFPGDNWPNPP